MSLRGLALLLCCLAVLLSQSTLRVRAAPADGACCLEQCCCQEMLEDSCCTSDVETPITARLVDACGCGSSEHDGVTHAVAHTVFLEPARIELALPCEPRSLLLTAATPRDLGRASPEPPVPRS